MKQETASKLKPSQPLRNASEKTLVHITEDNDHSSCRIWQGC